jgi:hypothetical protein
MSLRIGSLLNFPVVLMSIGCVTTGAREARDHVQGVQFAVDTAETPAPGRGAFKSFVGVVQFAAGRGRLDVTASRAGPALAVHGISIAAPLARPGDYYLFDSTGFVLVRPASRTFSSFALSRASWRHGDVREADAGFVKFGPLRADTIAPEDSVRLTQHGPVTIGWHLDQKQGAGPVRILARGRLDLADAPAGEASVARWFGVARALATMPGGVASLPPDSLQVTAAIILARDRDAREPESLIVLHALSDLASMQIDRGHLVLPAAYTETPWPGFEHADREPVSTGDVARWRTLPAESRK